MPALICSSLPLDPLEKCPEKAKTKNKLGDLEGDKNGLVLMKKIGQGHMSTVYLAMDRSTHRTIALKVKRKSELQNKHAMQMARLEKDILSSLNHPFLPSLLDHFESDNHTFLAMEYCSGGDINRFRYAQPNWVFSVSALRFYAAEVVLALENLHEKGIVYRDLKPENILVQANGHIMLTDFDLSLKIDTDDEEEMRNKRRRRSWDSVRDEQKSMEIVGTEDYIAPEILWCSGHAYPVDWWSLGVFLYEMVYGKTPFGGGKRKDTFFNIMSKELSLPETLEPQTPQTLALEDLIRKLLVKDPSLRLGSMTGALDIKSHHFFDGVCWDGLEFVSRPPFFPSYSPPLDLDLPLES